MGKDLKVPLLVVESGHDVNDVAECRTLRVHQALERRSNACRCVLERRIVTVRREDGVDGARHRSGHLGTGRYLDASRDGRSHDRGLDVAAQPLREHFDQLMRRSRQRSALLLAHQHRALVFEQVESAVVDRVSLEEALHLRIEVIGSTRLRSGRCGTLCDLKAHIAIDGAVHLRVEEKDVAAYSQRPLDGNLVGDEGDDVSVQTLRSRSALEVLK